MAAPTQGRRNSFRLDLNAYKLLDGTRPIRLERQPMELLILLAERKGQMVGREEIAARLWGEDVFVDTDRSINSIVRKLRQGLKDDPEHPEFVETVVGKGYRFIGPLEIIPRSADERQPANDMPAAVHAPAAGPVPARRFAWIIPVCVACIAIAALVWIGWRRSRATAGEATAVHALAVLPLENVSGDAKQEYFAAGMTQELTSEISQLPELRVISHTSVLQYAGSRKPLPEIARELHVDAVIEGSVLRSGDRVRITAQLVRAPADQTMWSSSYERELRDVLSLQREIAEDVAEQVKIKVSRQGRSGIQAVDPAAHDSYLQGLYHYDKNTEKDLQAAIANFQQALAKQPNYAAAYAGLADCYSTLGVFYWPPQLAMPQAKAAAQRALELDPSISEAHNSLANVYYYYEWDWQGAEREAKTALALNPSNAYAHDLLASVYGTNGRFREAMEELQRARELAPHVAGILGDTVFWAFFSRDYALAIANGQAAIQAQPENAFAQAFLGMAYAEQGKFTEALRHADLAHKYDDGPLIASFRANVYAIAGRRAQAEAALREVEKQRVERYSCAYEIGTGYILVGQTEVGFKWLENAYQGRSVCMILLKVDPRLDAVRSDRRLQTLLQRVGLGE